MKEDKQVFGTYEWAVANANFISGCIHNCKYCYSKEMAIRFKRKTALTWETEVVNLKQLNIKRKKINGLIMFPSSHDITPENLHHSIFFIRNLLASGNSILIVTKPHMVVIESICKNFSAYKNNILFRFTIGSNKTETLKFWEPGAPSYEERKKCLVYAYRKGFSTSISCEPMLDNSTEELVMDLIPYVTNSIWIGKANFLLRRLKMNGVTDDESLRLANALMEQQTDSKIKALYNNLCSNKKIKWKESIKKIVQLEVSKVKGLDI